jgi:hypothetical protein
MQDYEVLTAKWKKSTCRTFSEYARKVLLAEPVVMTTRNLSLDILIEAVNRTRAELAKLQEKPILSAEDRNRLFAMILDLKEAYYRISELCIPN